MRSVVALGDALYAFVGRYHQQQLTLRFQELYRADFDRVFNAQRKVGIVSGWESIDFGFTGQRKGLVSGSQESQSGKANGYMEEFIAEAHNFKQGFYNKDVFPILIYQ